MAEDLSLYTGTIIFKEISFTFSFDKTELRLIPSEENKHLVEFDWKMEEIYSGCFVPADPIPVEDPYLVGECNETKHRIIFIPKQGSTLGLYNSVVRISLSAYIICKYDRDTIDRISFSCPEINYIHPINQALKFTIPANDFQNKGVVTINTQSFDITTTKKQTFSVADKDISAYFGVSRSVSTSMDESPLRLSASLMFEFEATDDYQFIYRLWWIAREFVRFLCYRKNVFIPKADLSAPYEGGKHETFATMYLLDEDGDIESGTLKKGLYIKQSRIAGHEGQILSDIAEDNLYLRHLPETYRSGRHINAARFVMITAAFEWEFRRLYPKGIEKSADTIKAEESVSAHIQKCIDETGGKEKKIYKHLKRLVKADSLQTEIVQMGKDFSSVIGAFGDRLYQYNGQVLKYSEMGQRLSDQRNHFAHGDLDKDFIGLSLLDLMFMECVVYAMQLRYYGVEDEQIQKAINELFQLSIDI